MIVRLRQPGVPKGLLRIGSFLGIHLEEAFDEVNGVLGDWPPATFVAPVRCASLNLRLHFLLVTVEGRVPHEQHPHNHADAPQVALVRVAAATQHIRAHVGDGPARCHHECGRVPDLGKAKIDQLQLRRRILAFVKEILELQVTMHHMGGMKIAHRTEHLPSGFGRICIGINTSLLEAVVEFTTLAAFSEEANFCLRLEDVVEPGDVGVVED
mmetsp:Transcript_60715/g.123904  ORF Transcript_60715/g.123904 Transcript_60715/m.123904 type:complete len:212 (-) Transcript_60715:367-1002(-)